MQLPDYQSRSIVNLMASLQLGLGHLPHGYPALDLLPAEKVAASAQVLLLVIDGLGLNYLRAHPRAACLNEHLVGGLTSVFPPTTASAISTYLTGDAPQQHGLTGWHMYFRELGAVMAVLPGTARYGGTDLRTAGIDVAQLLQHRPFTERIDRSAFCLSPAPIAESAFSLAHLGPAELMPFDGLQQLVQRCDELLHADGDKYVFAYWPQLDGMGHRFGMWHEETREHLFEIDRAFETLIESVRGTDTLIVLCADHGQIDPEPEHRIGLDRHPHLRDCLLLPMCGETRAAYCYLRAGCETAFDDYVRNELADVADLIPASQLLEDGWFGFGEPHPELAWRVGDRLLLMKKDYTLKDWLPQEVRHPLIGVHGGLSDDELWVPLILAAC